MGKEEVSAKILILGESKVGKSSILNQFTEKVFTENLPPTLGIDYKIKKLTIDDTDIKLQIWDTAGQERFRSITESFYRGCHGVLLVFDLTDRDTFEKVKAWIISIHEKAGKNVVICLVGNKLDLKGADGVEMLPTHVIEELAVAHDIKYFLVSAKENISIHASFNYLAKEIKDKIVADARDNNNNSHKLGGQGGLNNKNCCN